MGQHLDNTGFQPLAVFSKAYIPSVLWHFCCTFPKARKHSNIKALQGLFCVCCVE
jgi:hypothetical protein